jgi:hypothetical protein
MISASATTCTVLQRHADGRSACEKSGASPLSQFSPVNRRLDGIDEFLERALLISCPWPHSLVQDPAIA